MLNRVVLLLFLLCAFFAFVKPASAAENPLAVANNKIGVHILDTSELATAAELVNHNGGDWGYVTIPIQSGDKNRVKWQAFMNECKKYHLIPIIRLATQSDFINNQVWRTPNESDIVDFANFLNSLEWPTKNRYIIVFNEVNRGDEWGGNANPAAYAHLLNFAVTIFKSSNPDFFIISAGLDNAAPDQGNIYFNEYTYFRKMNQAVPGIFNQIDGFASHSYPNPGFSQAPDVTSQTGVGSFIHERDLIRSLSNKTLPVFITETGWSSQTVSEATRIQYYNETFQTIWNDSDIVAVTPFLLRAGSGPFEQFTFITATGYKTKQYAYFYNMQKVKGVPSFPTHQVLAAAVQVKSKPVQESSFATKDMTSYKPVQHPFSISMVMANLLSYLIKR
jgi:hypothetical protein